MVLLPTRRIKLQFPCIIENGIVCVGAHFHYLATSKLDSIKAAQTSPRTVVYDMIVTAIRDAFPDATGALIAGDFNAPQRSTGSLTTAKVVMEFKRETTTLVCSCRQCFVRQVLMFSFSY